ncbi:molybdenum cofactor guanylyltransferase [Niallia sp. Krafla_26]|uniref:molybdenum cofactor guanylyltransferase n=1 Tax=Niallia sp. Krafla_26 TaxID=3064703 RepID=UPI003D17F992
MMKTTGIILAGGKSSRMGTNKALLTIEGKTVIERIVGQVEQIVDQCIIVTNHFQDYKFLQLPMVEDKWKDMGPLAGIEAGLTSSQTENNLIVACDMPFISIDTGKYLLTLLEYYQAVVPEVNGQLHPLFAAYRKSIVPAVTTSLTENNLRIRQLLHTIHVKIVKNQDLDSQGISTDDQYYFNMNHPTEYHRAIDFVKTKGGVRES